LLDGFEFIAAHEVHLGDDKRSAWERMKLFASSETPCAMPMAPVIKTGQVIEDGAFAFACGLVLANLFRNRPEPAQCALQPKKVASRDP